MVDPQFVEYEYRVLKDGEQIHRSLNAMEAIDIWRNEEKSVLQRRQIGPWENAE